MQRKFWWNTRRPSGSQPRAARLPKQRAKLARSLCFAAARVVDRPPHCRTLPRGNKWVRYARKTRDTANDTRAGRLVRWLARSLALWLSLLTENVPATPIRRHLSALLCHFNCDALITVPIMRNETSMVSRRFSLRALFWTWMCPWYWRIGRRRFAMSAKIGRPFRRHSLTVFVIILSIHGVYQSSYLHFLIYKFNFQFYQVSPLLILWS